MDFTKIFWHIFFKDVSYKENPKDFFHYATWVLGVLFVAGILSLVVYNIWFV